MFKTIASVCVGVLLAIGLFLVIRVEVKDHQRLNAVVEFLNQSIQNSQALKTNEAK